ncbi:MAG: addiction module protein [Nevskia sp.]|nr:addiction module protein [Nevskia sp.]
MNPEAIEREALGLSLPERAALAHKLLISLENFSDSEHEQAWFDEAERRAAQIDSGAAQLISSEEVSRKARALLK